MKDLIEALQIFAKYANDDRCPTWCEHDTFNIACGIEYGMVSSADLTRLDQLGFYWNADNEGFTSFRFGSC